MSRRALTAAAGLLAGTLLLGCHGANEGAIDYRYFPPPDVGALRLAQVLGTVTPHADAPLLHSPLAAGTAQLQRAERKYAATLSPAAAATAIHPGEGFSITLQQAFVSDFAEGGVTPADVFDKRGEIAVVAGVRELTGGEAGGPGLGAGFVAAAPALDDRPTSGRVVFYSGDVTGRSRLVGDADGQYLNFSAVPLHVAHDYAGGPIEISLYLLELDGAERDRSRDLLATLAAFGDRAYPPGSPVLALLDELGGALLASVPDESVEFRYTCVLHPCREGALPQAQLREGNYVFIKQDHRRLPGPLRAARNRLTDTPDPGAPVDWDRVRFDPLQGRLMTPADDGVRYRFYRDHTYLTLQVRRSGATDGLAPYCDPLPPPELLGLSGLTSLSGLAPPIGPAEAALPEPAPTGLAPTARDPGAVAVEANGGSTLPLWTRLPPPAAPALPAPPPLPLTTDPPRAE
ncbi:hypothetical protein [Alienimonas californiensis]|uniref:Lipoprotein n=1 Tax=Alienimonas californiensis TaxID=2527989 RepID=A0A517PC15_9PLAN|nr:hypothetical protein [Alienimonas californiensis]QDT16927.1 hypothetical protein CA12_30370 [Alienimonas californiensis]